MLAAALAYLAGSLVFGLLFSALRGEDIRLADAPGTSGVLRRYGLLAGAAALLFDAGKGAAAIWLAQRLGAPLWLAAAGSLLGHLYPLYFRFRGGAGVAPALGALAAADWQLASLAVLAALALLWPYRRWLASRLGLGTVPAISAAGLLAALTSSFWLGHLSLCLAITLILGLRALQLLLSVPRAQKP